MHSKDLPVELWREITSYLPRSTLYRLMGINRTLFNLAMDDFYREIRFISDDVRTRELLKSTIEPQNAARVRKLLIRPDFLPGLDEAYAHGMLDRWIWGLRSSKDDATFLAAVSAIRPCSKIREVKVVLHDHRFTPSFGRFLLSVWQISLGTRLHTLSIDTTWIKIPRFLQPLLELSETLTNLQEFTLEVSPSRVGHGEASTEVTVRSLLSFLRALSGQLTALRLSSPYFKEIAISLDTIPHFPKLERLEIFAFFGEGPQQFKCLTRFIASHEHTLRYFLLKPQPRYYLGKVAHQEYSAWLNPQTHDEELKAFAKPLYKLETLHLGLCDGPEDQNFFASEDSLTPRVVPNLSTFVPNITSLVLTCLPLTLDRISHLIDGLPEDSAGRRQLRSLRATLLFTDALSASLFDMFALRLDSLKSLAITYCRPYGVDALSLDFEAIEEAFYREMEEKRYDGWELDVLRLTKPEACPTPHPDMTLMEAVATSFRRKPQLDHSYICSC
ncbi:hypothetical protein CVT26_015753 [Gymnopilus dilepis]|uniref:F-box domain-containing protein n=1 Tax=Gymnopilus dilepis TaxID=231916 RepID=A0A409VFM7_9AGAR|nr:hypothetical protein CVT26_015753 [Gymnopilus dilepis]